MAQEQANLRVAGEDLASELGDLKSRPHRVLAATTVARTDVWIMSYTISRYFGRE